MVEEKKEDMRKILEEATLEVQEIVREVIKHENLHLHEARPRLVEDIERIVIDKVKK